MDRMDLRPVVVAVDRTASARAAARWAAELAADWNAPLRIVHGVPGDPQDPRTHPVPRWLVELADAAQRLGVRRVDVELQPGDVLDVLVARAYGARLLVLGSAGAGAVSGMLVGSVATAMLARVTCPLAVVRGPEQGVVAPRGGAIVVGVDGSTAGACALAFAADLAASSGARLRAVHASNDVPTTVPSAALLATELAPVLRYHPEVVVEREILDGAPLRALLAKAGEARMIVVGTRATAGGDEPALLGSTSTSLVELAPCPVVVVHPPADGTRPFAALSTHGVSS